MSPKKIKGQKLVLPLCVDTVCVLGVVCAPGRSGRGCGGRGRRRCRCRELWAAGRWSLRPAEGAVCSHWGSGTSAAPPNSSAQSLAALPSSGCQTTCQTDEEMKEYNGASVELSWLQKARLHRSWYILDLYLSAFILPTLPEGLFSLRKPEGEENKDGLMTNSPESIKYFQMFGPNETFWILLTV